jgi:PAS domain S-box-containing protein
LGHDVNDGDPVDREHLEPTGPDSESTTPKFRPAKAADLPPVSPDPGNVTGRDTAFPPGLSSLLADQLNDAILVIDSSGHIVYSNRASAAVLGWDRADLVGRPLVEIIPERFRNLHNAGFARFLAVGDGPFIGHPVRLPAQRPDGSEVTVEASVNAWAPATAAPDVARPDVGAPDIAAPADAPVAIGVLRRVGDVPSRSDRADRETGLLTSLELELEQTRRSREFLLRASRVLAEARNLQETLERLATMAVPRGGREPETGRRSARVA